MAPKIQTVMKSYSDTVVVIDYGMGNMWSVISALKYLKIEYIVTSDPCKVEIAKILLLPGVGSFRKGIESLIDLNLIDPIIEAVTIRKAKILGICLGFQLLAISSTEDGYTSGLGVIPGIVERFSEGQVNPMKVPHIGFSTININKKEGLFEGFDTNADFYFVHSYRISPLLIADNYATCKYGEKFLAAYHHKNVMGTQFHPEKSQTNGLALINNFMKI
ncbi:imidazole glycerol phosphate synthase subunit HisH [Prochlorococcus marinus]|uniref:Imidazole glycerol phosphate synthase subunit HisH n=1 Tax=Prochlorococcus marinus (strain MIT 9303) TaxID=59922 RepID=A2CB97_PROM3|nr:imidazole glycerol phosphate synthase subunit HisH [Prochlorococcus marinus]ABM78757.1 Glutamine amidotransferase [Prochlorococcus marinus str. MIT 9303]